MMNHKSQPKLQEQVELKVVPVSEIICTKCGSDSYIKGGFTSSGNKRYTCKKCQARFVPFSNWKLIKGEDVWTAEDLGLQVMPYISGANKLNFSCIHQDWLKEHVKTFIKYISSITTSFASVLRNLYGLKYFSDFLQQKTKVTNIEDINRSVIVEYLEYLDIQRLKQGTKIKNISNLSRFLEIGVTNKWFKVEPYLIQAGDYPKQTNLLPRYIPDEVVRQLNQQLDSLPESVMRMLLVIQECGLRIGELCQLPLNCLKQDSKSGWFIQFMRWKMKSEATLPISMELAKVIQEQQGYIQQHLGNDFPYLFCRVRIGGTERKFIPTPKVMTRYSFAKHIKRLADKFNICDSTGTQWNFQTHQFRHTVATRMINNNVPQHIVQRYLGHDSPEMTSVYAHIHDATLRKEIDKYLDTKVVNINGEVIQSLTPELDTDSNLQWMKKKVLAETLPNGYCGLPTQLTCSKGNACLTCSDFRTTIEFLDQHKQQLERASQVLEVAQTNGWERQIQVNKDVKSNLERIIATLERNQDV